MALRAPEFMIERCIRGAAETTAPGRNEGCARRTMIRIRLADFAADRDVIRELRSDVFVEEQGVPRELELDARDPRCVHVLAFFDESPVGTARVDLEHGARVGRLAVTRPMRGRGIGTALMRRLHELARERGFARVWCHAQAAAEPFYAQLGYSAVGERFVEAGIEHVRMEKVLG